MFWEHIEQARQRLNGAVVLRDGLPIRFGDITSKNINVKDIATGSVLKVNLDDKEFNDFRDLPEMGFVNVPGELYFTMRVPVRSQTHGLSRSNTKMFLYKGGRFISDIPTNYDKFVDDYGLYYAEAVKGAFPSFDKAVEYVSDRQPVAFSRKWALAMKDGIKTLFRLQDEIGIVSSDGACLLKPLYLCYREELQELGISNVLKM